MKERAHAFGKEEYSALDNLIYRLRKRQVGRRIPKDVARVADFGSGYDCRTLRGVREYLPETELIALDTEFDEQLYNEKQLTLVAADLNQPVSLEDSSVDVVISLAVLEHLDAPEVMMRECVRVLRPGGKLLLTTPGPTAKPLLEFLAFKLKIIDAHEIADHKNYFSPADLRNMAVEAGFTAESITEDTFILGMNNIFQATKST